jgi:hypothetical protein
MGASAARLPEVADVFLVEVEVQARLLVFGGRAIRAHGAMLVG